MHRFFFSAVFVASFAAASPTEAGGPLVWYSYEASGTATTLTDVAGVGNGGLGYHATATNSTFQPDRPPGADFISSVPANAGSLAVDGTSGSGGISNDTNILTNAAIIGAGGFTMETWFRRRALNNASNSFQKLLQTEIENFHIPSFSDEVRFSDGETPTVLLGTALVDEWHHVAAVFTYRAANPDVGDLTGTINFYYDGAPVPTAPNVLLKLRDIVDNPIYLGSSNVASESFAGDLFETRISLGALSRADLLLPAAVADAGQDIIVKGEGGNALVNLDGSASTGYDLQYEWFGPDNVTIGEGALATGVFPAGTTEVTLKVTDGYGGTSYDYVSITVSDPIPLVLTCTTDLGVLWPPNHEMRPVTIFVGAAGMEGDVQVNCVVTSNEPDDGTGDGAFTGDVDLTDGWESPVPVPLVYDATLGLYVGEVLLRAERDGDGAGRTYSIHCAADDGKQQAATASTAVIVPRGGRK